MVARSMAAATNEPRRDVVKAGKRRKVEAVKGSKSAAGNQEFHVKSWRGGTRNTFSVWAASKSAANKLPQLRVGRWGLAKACWFWGLKKLGPGAKFGFATASAKRGATSATDVQMSMRKDDPWVRITNRLPYAMEAVQGGEATLNGAMGKAARGLEKSIDEQLKRRMKAK